MMVYRIIHALYKDDLSGTGAKLYGARWNQPGSPMLYTAQHISLSVLEMLVHINWEDISNRFQLLSIFLPDDAPMGTVEARKLKANWQDDPDYSAYMGTAFIKSGDLLTLRVPSAVIPEEYNYLINPMHPDFKKVKIKKSTAFIFDKRLHW